MLSRLPTSLAQLEVGNNSEKLKTKIRQILCFLYKSKTLIETTVNNLITTMNTVQQYKRSLWTLKIVRQMIKQIYLTIYWQT